VGIFQNKADFISLPFFVGNLPVILIHLGKFASENQQSIIDNIFRGSLLPFVLGFVMLFCLFSSIGAA
jgi:hypothetical protein